MNLPQKIFNNTIIQIIGKIATTGLNLFAFALMTRELGQSGFGEYTTVITFLSFFAIIADLGLTLVTVQMINNEKEESIILGNLFGLRLVSSLLFISLAPIIVIYLNYNDNIKLGVLIASASFVFNALNQIMVGLFQSKLKMDRVAWAETLSRFIMIIGVILSIKLKWGLNGMLLATTAASLTSFILHFIFAKKFARIKPLFNWLIWKRIINLSWPLAITIAFNLIYLRADTLILSLVKTADAVGLYGAAYKIIDVLSSLPFMFAGIILPILISAWQKQETERFNNILQKSFDIMAAAALPMLIGTQFLSDHIINLIAGPNFQEAGVILRVLIFAVAAIFLGNMMAHAVIAIKAQKKVIWIYVFTSLSSLLAYIIFIPRFSYFGAAAVTIYSEVMIALLSTWFIYKHLKFRLRWQSAIKSLGASLLMGTILWLWPKGWLNSSIGLLLSMTASASFYLLFLAGLRAFNRSDFLLIIGKKI